SPPVATVSAAHASSNNSSLVLLVSIGDRRILLTADIEAPAEAWLVSSGWTLRADALVVPHQGSRSSSTPAFVEAVRPGVAVASAGLDNQFGHPHEEVVARYEGIPFYRTDEHGSVTLTSDGA